MINLGTDRWLIIISKLIPMIAINLLFTSIIYINLIIIINLSL